MAAPSGTKWGSTVGSYGRIGIYISKTETETKISGTVKTYFWSKYGVTDSNAKYYYNAAGTASTLIGTKTIKTTENSGEGWSTTNQVLLDEHDFSYNKTTSKQTKYFAIKLTGVDRVGGTMTASISLSIPAKKSYKVTYDANGGTGAPAAQTKWYGTSLKLSSTKPTRAGYTFQGWGTSTTDTSPDWQPGGNYTANASDTLYAIWKANTYKVTYDANGGTGAPAVQTKTYGVNLTLSKTIPTRTNYNFKGWGTSEESTTVSYAAGASYTKNAAITLYAIWELAYKKPQIIDFTVDRCDSAGAFEEVGTNALVKFKWQTEKAVTSIKINYKKATDTTWTETTITATGTTGTVSEVIGEGTIDTEYEYNIQVVIADENGSNDEIRNISPIAFAMDFLAGGKGVAFGKPADTENVVDFAFTPRFQNAPEFMVDGRVRHPVQMFHGDENGDGIKIGDAGCVVIGAGESTSNFMKWSEMEDKGGSEQIYITSDNDVHIVTNLQSAYEDRKEVLFKANGTTHFPGGIRLPSNKAISGYISGYSGDYYNLIYTSDNNVYVGSGSYPPEKIVMRTSGRKYEQFVVATDANGDRIYSTSIYKRTYDNGANMYITSQGTLGRAASSSRKYKKDIIPLEENLNRLRPLEMSAYEVEQEPVINPETLYDIPVMQYKYIDGYLNAEDAHVGKDVIGIMAEDVAEKYPIASILDEDGQPESWNKDAVLVGLLYLVQQQKKEIDELKKMIQGE